MQSPVGKEGLQTLTARQSIWVCQSHRDKLGGLKNLCRMTKPIAMIFCLVVS